MSIHAPEGTRMAYLTSMVPHPQEMEMLLDRGLPMKIVAVERRENGLPPIVHVEVHPPTGVTQLFNSNDQELNLEQAQAALDSPKQARFAEQATAINDQYSARTIETRGLIGDTTSYGTENSLPQRIVSGAGESRAIAAAKGLAGRQLTVLSFIHSRSGNDLMVSVPMPTCRRLNCGVSLMSEGWNFAVSTRTPTSLSCSPRAATSSPRWLN
jgi:hypothetical protein